MEESLGVEVAHPFGRVPRNLHPHVPSQRFGTENQLFQTPTFDVLSIKKDTKYNLIEFFLIFLIDARVTSVRAWSCPPWTQTPRNLRQRQKKSIEDPATHINPPHHQQSFIKKKKIQWIIISIGMPKKLWKYQQINYK